MPVLLVQLGNNSGLEQQDNRCIEGERFKVYFGQRAYLQLAALLDREEEGKGRVRDDA